MYKLIQRIESIAAAGLLFCQLSDEVQLIQERVIIESEALNCLYKMHLIKISFNSELRSHMLVQ